MPNARDFVDADFLMEPKKPLEKIYTAQEAADRLRVTKRIVQKLGRDFDACTKIGEKFLFTETDLEIIWAKQREASERDFEKWRFLTGAASPTDEGKMALAAAKATLRALRTRRETSEKRKK